MSWLDDVIGSEGPEDFDEGGSDPCSLGHVFVKRATAKAILVVNVNLDEFWIPKSVVHEDSEAWDAEKGKNSGELIVKQWWAEKEGLV